MTTFHEEAGATASPGGPSPSAADPSHDPPADPSPDAPAGAAGADVASSLRGLTADEAAERASKGLTNHTTAHAARTPSQLVRAHVFTRFNAVLASLFVLTLTLGSLLAVWFGVVLVATVAVGVVPEWRATRTIDRLALVDRPSVTVVRDGRRQLVPADDVVQDDVVELEPGAPVLADGEVLAAEALEVDESLLSGESLPGAKARGATVRSGSFVTAGRGWYRVVQVGDEAHANRLVGPARSASLLRSELRRDSDRILACVACLMVPIGALLVLSQSQDGVSVDGLRAAAAGTAAMAPEGLVLLATVAGVVSAARLERRGVLVQQAGAVDTLARVDTFCIDKTGTLTEPVLDVADLALVDAADDDSDNPAPADRPTRALSEQQARKVLGAMAWADASPNDTMSALASAYRSPGWAASWVVPFTSARRFCGAGFAGEGHWLLGAPDVLLGAASDPEAARRTAALVDPPSRAGRRVLLLARLDAPPPEDPTPAGVPASTPVAVVTLDERIKASAAGTVALLRRQGVDVKVLSGDDPRTVAAVATRLKVPGSAAPVDARRLPDDDPEALGKLVADRSVFGRVDAEQKQDLVAELRRQGRVVAMAGDGVNDVPALGAADLGIAMGSGSPASRAVAPVVLLDSSFASLPDVVSEGRRVAGAVERVANLFVARSVYAAVLAVAVGAFGMAFPFQPVHLALVGALILGAPALLLAVAPAEGGYRPGFVGRALRFALPAGAVAATATFTSYTLASDAASLGRAGARTAATVALFLVGLWMLVILTRGLAVTVARLRWGVIAGTGVAFGLALVAPPLQGVFDLEPGSLLSVLSAVGVAAMAGVALELGWQVSGWSASEGGDA